MSLHQQRSQHYFRLSTQLALLDNQQLAARLVTDAPEEGWSRHQTMTVDGLTVFVKRVPVTDLELQHSFSTANLYNLPAYYHYGIGSAGFGVYRELVAHIKTTNWVLSGEIAHFPLLYHYRVLPLAGARPSLDLAWYQRYVTYWGNSAQIGQYIRDRAQAGYELVFFLEYIPTTLPTLLIAQPEQVAWVLAELAQTLTFLRQHGMIHFDAHFYNLLTDGQHIYLTDFGLLLDQSFTLGADEAAFFALHQDYDHGHSLSNLIYLLYDRFEKLPEATQLALRAQYEATDPDTHFYKLLRALLENIAELRARGIIDLPETYCAQLTKYRALLLLMGDFYAALRANPAKDTPFPHQALRRLLAEVGLSTA